jgi:hypothetical protein
MNQAPFDGLWSSEYVMQILVNADSYAVADEQMLGRVRDAVALGLHRYHVHVSRAEVELSDLAGCSNGGRDLRCRIEVRLRGCQPLAVEHAARSLELAVDGALYRLARIIDGAHERSFGSAAGEPSGRSERACLAAG